MQITFPETVTDLLPFLVACFSILYGLFALFAPRLFLRMAGLDTLNTRRAGLSEIRATLAGFPLGTGLAAFAFYDQFIAQWIIGGAWLLTGFGRLVSILSDDASTFGNWLWLFLNLALALACFAPTLGLV